MVESLENMCLKYIGQNVQKMIGARQCSLPENVNMDLVYADQELVLPKTIAERLITTLSETRRLDDVTMSIFNYKHCTYKIHVLLSYFLS